MATLTISLLLLAFPPLWCGIPVLTGRLSGWASLAEFYCYSGIFTGHQWKYRTAFFRLAWGSRAGCISASAARDSIWR